MPTLTEVDVPVEMVSVKTLSRMIDTPEKTIRDWVLKKYRDIPFLKVGHQLRFPMPQIKHWALGTPQPAPTRLKPGVVSKHR